MKFMGELGGEQKHCAHNSHLITLPLLTTVTTQQQQQYLILSPPRTSICSFSSFFLEFALRLCVLLSSVEDE
jgi:hypothetical protein